MLHPLYPGLDYFFITCHVSNQVRGSIWDHGVIWVVGFSFRIKEWLSNLKFALWNYTTSKYRRFFIWFSFSRKNLVHLHIVRFKTQTVLENSDCYLHVLEWCRHEKVKFNDLKSFQCFESYYKSYFVYVVSGWWLNVYERTIPRKSPRMVGD